MSSHGVAWAPLPSGVLCGPYAAEKGSLTHLNRVGPILAVPGPVYFPLLLLKFFSPIILHKGMPV